MYQTRSASPRGNSHPSHGQATLMLRHCARCKVLMAPQAVACFRCHADGLEWAPSSGAGAIVSCRAIHHTVNRLPGVLSVTILAVIELDDGPWVFAAIEGDVVPISDRRVRVRFLGRPLDSRFPLFEIDSDDQRHRDGAVTATCTGEPDSEQSIATSVDEICSMASVRTALDRCDLLEAARSVNAEAKSLLKFAVRWAPSGGASPSELLVTFGVTRRRFLGLLHETLELQQTDNRATRGLKRQLLESLDRAWNDRPPSHPRYDRG